MVLGIGDNDYDGCDIGDDNNNDMVHIHDSEWDCNKKYERSDGRGPWIGGSCNILAGFWIYTKSSCHAQLKEHRLCER